MTAGPDTRIPLIEARHVSRVLHETVPVTLVRDVNLMIGEKQFVAITGPSGSGKSSLLYLLGLLDLPTEGEVLIQGRSTAHMDEDERAQTRLARLGFVFQFHFLLPEFTVAENIAMPMRALGRLSGKAIIARVDELLASLGLAEHGHKTPDGLSGGQRQRVAVARALANDPQVILADEPTGNLDTATSRDIMNLLTALNRDAGITIAMVTHEPDMAEYAHHVIHFLDGAIAHDGPKEEAA
jgi:lipoprotein-releasing system ATP-binding protein